jgi:hypothetical protein
MRQRSTPQALFLIVSFVCLAHAHSPAREDLDIPLDAVLRRQSDVLVTSSAGIFWADLQRKEWHKLPLPAEMPVGGRFGSVPDGSQQILYYSTQQYKLIDGQKRGIYGSTDAGKTWQLRSENADYGPVALLSSGALFAVTNAGRSNGPAVIEVSRDLGKTWRDITGNSSGEIGRLFPDPDHPGLICLDSLGRGYILQAEREL